MTCLSGAQLKVRAALMPEVVSAVDALEAGAGASRVPEYVGAGGRPRQRSWAVSPKLFPCELSPEAQAAVTEARPKGFFAIQAALRRNCIRTQALWLSARLQRFGVACS